MKDFAHALLQLVVLGPQRFSLTDDALQLLKGRSRLKLAHPVLQTLDLLAVFLADVALSLAVIGALLGEGLVAQLPHRAASGRGDDMGLACRILLAGR